MDRVFDVTGRAWDAITAYYRTPEPENLIGVEITDLGGFLPVAHVGVFITCGQEGRKIFLDTEAARDLASVLINMAGMIEAGAVSADTN